MKIFNNVQRLRATLIAVSLGLAVVGCNPIGDGVGPVSLMVSSPTLAPGTTSARAYRCLPSLLTAVLTFSDGSTGNFSNRVRWTSSNPSVIAVSNGDLPVPGVTNSFYPIGTMVASSSTSGTAVITADFSGLTSSINVDTGVPTAFTVKTVDAQTGLSTTPSGNSFRIGPGTSQDLTVTALVDNIEQNVEGAATWVIETPNTAVATISPSAGVVAGFSSGGPLVARADFQACGVSARTSVSVANIQSISLAPEFTSNGAADNLFLLNSERIRVLADFGNGPEQDISLFSTLTSSQTSVAAFNPILGATNILTAITAGGPVTIGATHVQSTTTLTAPDIVVTTVDGTLQTVAISPTTGSIVIGQDRPLIFHALGTYADGRTQDISRRAVWTSSDTTVATVSTGLAVPGQALSAGRTTGSVTITATVSATPTVPAATAQLTTTALPPAGP